MGLTFYSRSSIVEMMITNCVLRLYSTWIRNIIISIYFRLNVFVYNIRFTYNRKPRVENHGNRYQADVYKYAFIYSAQYRTFFHFFFTNTFIIILSIVFVKTDKFLRISSAQDPKQIRVVTKGTQKQYELKIILTAMHYTTKQHHKTA